MIGDRKFNLLLQICCTILACEAYLIDYQFNIFRLRPHVWIHTTPPLQPPNVLPHFQQRFIMDSFAWCQRSYTYFLIMQLTLYYMLSSSTISDFCKKRSGSVTALKHTEYCNEVNRKVGAVLIGRLSHRHRIYCITVVLRLLRLACNVSGRRSSPSYLSRSWQSSTCAWSICFPRGLTILCAESFVLYSRWSLLWKCVLQPT